MLVAILILAPLAILGLVAGAGMQSLLVGLRAAEDAMHFEFGGSEDLLIARR